MKEKRPSWDEYFTQITHLVATRSTCLRRKVGALLVKEKRILSTGYNGAPRNLPHCKEAGCLRDKLNIPSPKVDSVIGELTKGGFTVTRTHFRTNSIKTNAPIDKIVSAMKKVLNI